MDKIRIIKRYGNRRLYDTHTSRYITLEEIQEYVIKQIQFKIIDAKSNEDMTNYILLQIISSQENGHLPMFSTAILENIIRFYGNPVQKAFSQFLEKGIALFINPNETSFKDAFNKTNFKDIFNHNTKSNIMDLFTDIAKKNMAMWQSTFDKTASQKFSKKAKMKK